MIKIDGHKAKSLRESKGLTQLYIATIVGVTTDTISRWENRRYPSIKRENARKLAEALTVSIEEILEDLTEKPPAAAKNNEPPHDRSEDLYAARRAKIKRALWALPILIVALILGIFWFYGNQQTPKISAYRLLPRHVPVGRPFPVLITVTARHASSFSLLVKELPPRGCVALQGVPPFAAVDKKTGALKWISRTKGEKISFSYMAKIRADISAGETFNFNGTVTLKTKKSAATDILGDATLTVADFHWADTDKDGRINDEEILSVYDNYSVIEGLNYNEALIDDIWSGQGYQWDQTTGKYIILP